MDVDEPYMARALEVARRAPRTSPNPKVGAVVVRDGHILAEAWHRGAGHSHAEAAALAGIDAAGADLYVTLEPCIHTGRMPPCAPAIVASGIRRVVVASGDPDPRVNGGGFAYLRAAGIEVVTGVREAEEHELNRSYRHRRATGSPLLTLKLALSLDGRVAAADGSSRWITGDPARTRVHRRRAEVDAVLVGAGTVVADDPALTTRDEAGVDRAEQPAAVVVDSSGRTPPGARLFTAERPVIVAAAPDVPHDVQVAWKEAGAEVVVLPRSGAGVDLLALMDHLRSTTWLEVCCEGGAALATELLAAGLVDRLELYYAPKVIGAPGAGIGALGIASIADAFEFQTVTIEALGDDVLVVADRRDNG